ncbi:hypothetical protein LSM04_003513 [Trypanosoma melophagium]|uniref:uncharacterized protein n=1 Tax=Trypanosoma melophagium TaxID=715481 RepID=UPI00351A1A00|nr:hypothetical protein LSM04_003513 [Trypanosoma melophagium]
MYSPLYTGPFTLAKADTPQGRVVAFPRLQFPSREKVFFIPTTTTTTLSTTTTALGTTGISGIRQDDPLGRSFHTTRSAMMRSQHTARKLRNRSSSARSRATTPTVTHYNGSSNNSSISNNTTNNNNYSSKMNSINDKENERPVSALKSPMSSTRAISPRLHTEARAARSRNHVSCSNDTTLNTENVKKTPCRPRSHSGIQSNTTPRVRRVISSRTPVETVLEEFDNEDDVYEEEEEDEEDCSLLFVMSSVEKEKKNTKEKGNNTSNRLNGKGTNDVMEITEKKEKAKVSKGEPTEGNSTLCTANHNSVIFDFPKPISLSHITVSTPGNGGGPASYEVGVKHAHGTDFMTAGGGELRDIAGVQTMAVLVSARLFPVDRVRCVFAGGGADMPGFRVRDLKIHGKPFTG